MPGKPDVSTLSPNSGHSEHPDHLNHSPDPGTLTLSTPPEQILLTPAPEVTTTACSVPPIPFTDPFHMRGREIHSMLDSLNGLTFQHSGKWGRYSRTLRLVVETQYNTYRATAKIILQVVRGRKLLSRPEWSATAGKTVSERKILLQKLLETLQTYASAFKSGSILVYRLHQEIGQAHATLKKCMDSVDEKAHRLVTVSHSKAKEIAREVMDALDVEVDSEYDMLTCLPKKPTRTKFAVPTYCSRVEDHVETWYQWYHDTTCIVVAKVPADSFNVWWYPDNLDTVREKIRAMIPHPDTTLITPETLQQLNRSTKTARDLIKTVDKPYRYLIAVCTPTFTTLPDYPYLVLTDLEAEQWAVHTGHEVITLDGVSNTTCPDLQKVLECAIGESIACALESDAYITKWPDLPKDTAIKFAEIGVKKLKNLKKQELVEWHGKVSLGLNTKALMIPELLLAGQYLNMNELAELDVLNALKDQLKKYITVNTHASLKGIPSLQTNNSYLRATVTALLPVVYLNSATANGHLEMIDPNAVLTFWEVIAEPLKALEKKEINDTDYAYQYCADVRKIIKTYKHVMDKSLGTVTF